jgi:hypothetical protein
MKQRVETQVRHEADQRKYFDVSFSYIAVSRESPRLIFATNRLYKSNSALHIRRLLRLYRFLRRS